MRHRAGRVLHVPLAQVHAVLGQQERACRSPLGRHRDQRAQTVRRSVAQVDFGRGDGEGLQKVIEEAKAAVASAMVGA